METRTTGSPESGSVTYGGGRANTGAGSPGRSGSPSGAPASQHVNQVRCEECGATFNSREKLNEHNRENHGGSGRRPGSTPSASERSSMGTGAPGNERRR